MLGTFRLLLAILVALSHVNFRIEGLNPGVIAVVCFYLISGYVMTGLIRRHYFSWSAIPAFYLDRAMRLLPQYYLLLALVLCWFFVSGNTNSFLQHSPSFLDWFFNLSIVPLNYFMFNHSDQFTAIPPAWSLGAEIQFYILFPIILLCRARWLTLVIALAVFVSASVGLLHTDYFGYRLLPGVLTFFVLGSFLFDLQETRVQLKKYAILMLFFIAVFAYALYASAHLDLPYNRETLLGLAVGITLLALLGNKAQRQWDNRLGDLSYGVFLNHFLIQWVSGWVPTTFSEMTIYIALSLFLSFLTQALIERPVLIWRKKLRTS